MERDKEPIQMKLTIRRQKSEEGEVQPVLSYAASLVFWYKIASSDQLWQR